MHAVRLAIVVAPNCADLVEHFARDREVWAVRCPEHRRAARAAPGRVSLFTRDPRCAEDLLLRVLQEVEPEWSELEVIGAAPSYAVVRWLQDYDVERIEPSASGFSAYRS